MAKLKELKEEYHRISEHLELHRGLLTTLQKVRSGSGWQVETQWFDEVVNGETKIIAIFGDRIRKLEQKIYE